MQLMCATLQYKIHRLTRNLTYCNHDEYTARISQTILQIAWSKCIFIENIKFDNKYPWSWHWSISWHSNRLRYWPLTLSLSARLITDFETLSTLNSFNFCQRFAMRDTLQKIWLEKIECRYSFKNSNYCLTYVLTETEIPKCRTIQRML